MVPATGLSLPTDLNAYDMLLRSLAQVPLQNKLFVFKASGLSCAIPYCCYHIYIISLDCSFVLKHFFGYPVLLNDLPRQLARVLRCSLLGPPLLAL